MDMLDKPLKIALLISFGIHSAVLAPWSDLKFQKLKKPKTQIEVTYFEITEEPEVEISEKIEKIVPPKKTVKKEPPEKEEIIEKKTPQPKIQIEEKIVLEQKAISRRAIRLESTPDLEDNISYLSYSQLIRERIRQYLFRNYTESMGSGDVTASFVLRSNGALAGLRVISFPNARLRDLSARSIRQSSPFKPFPKELDLEEISFKITVSFKAD